MYKQVHVLLSKCLRNPIIVKKKTKITCYYLYIIANRKLHSLVCCRII